MSMNIAQTKSVLTYFPVAQSILICGNHGIGKSEAVKQAAADLKVPCIDIRLSQCDVGDLKGMPFHVKGRTVFAPPDFFPLDEIEVKSLHELLDITEEIATGTHGDKGILFLDEINRANREVQQAAFELVLDRRLNMRPLPKGWRVVAAINAEDNIYSVNSMDPAFLSRFFVINFEPSQQEFFAYGEKKGWHPVILNFLRKMPEFIDPTTELLNDASAQGVKKLHDRRSWEKFSNTLNEFTRLHQTGAWPVDPVSNGDENLNWFYSIALGYVGHLAGTKIMDYVKTEYKALDAEAILEKFDKAVEAHLKAVVEKNGVTEMAGYNEQLIAYIKKNVKEKLSAKQSKNLSRYLTLVPNELKGDLWQKINQECKSVSEAWYKDDKANGKLVLDALVAPDAAKKRAKEAKPEAEVTPEAEAK